MARGAADKERGITHEEAVLEWARQRWPAPGYEILAHAQAYPVVGEPGLVAGMKAEYDALVVDSAQQLTVVVEAKAGGALFDDLAKMLTAREAMVVRGAIHVRCGKQKHAQQKLIPVAPLQCRAITPVDLQVLFNHIGKLVHLPSPCKLTADPDIPICSCGTTQPFSAPPAPHPRFRSLPLPPP